MAFSSEELGVLETIPVLEGDFVETGLGSAQDPEGGFSSSLP